jgi:hypothetical protein
MHTKEATKYVGKRIYFFSDDLHYDNTLPLDLILVEIFIMSLMTVLTLADSFCCAWFIYRSLYRYKNIKVKVML